MRELSTDIQLYLHTFFDFIDYVIWTRLNHETYYLKKTSAGWNGQWQCVLNSFYDHKQSQFPFCSKVLFAPVDNKRKTDFHKDPRDPELLNNSNRWDQLISGYPKLTHLHVDLIYLPSDVFLRLSLSFQSTLKSISLMNVHNSYATNINWPAFIAALFRFQNLEELKLNSYYSPIINEAFCKESSYLIKHNAPILKSLKSLSLILVYFVYQADLTGLAHFQNLTEVDISTGDELSYAELIVQMPQLMKISLNTATALELATKKQISILPQVHTVKMKNNQTCRIDTFEQNQVKRFIDERYRVLTFLGNLASLKQLDLSTWPTDQVNVYPFFKELHNLIELTVCNHGNSVIQPKSEFTDIISYKQYGAKWKHLKTLVLRIEWFSPTLLSDLSGLSKTFLQDLNLIVNPAKNIIKKDYFQALGTFDCLFHLRLDLNLCKEHLALPSLVKIFQDTNAFKTLSSLTIISNHETIVDNILMAMDEYSCMPKLSKLILDSLTYKKVVLPVICKLLNRPSLYELNISWANNYSITYYGDVIRNFIKTNVLSTKRRIKVYTNGSEIKY